MQIPINISSELDQKESSGHNIVADAAILYVMVYYHDYVYVSIL